jgi:hypothetical protein
MFRCQENGYEADPKSSEPFLKKSRLARRGGSLVAFIAARVLYPNIGGFLPGSG